MNATLRAEFLKLRTTKTVAALAGLAVAVTVLIAIVESATAGTGRGMAIPSLATPAGLRDALASTGFALIAAAVLGTVIVTGEFRHKTATTTYLDQPSRGRVLGAKALAAAVAGALLGLAAVTTATGIALGFAATRGHPLALSAATIARYGAGAVIGAGLLAAAGAGAGSLIRHQAGAIIAVFAWGFAVELIVGGTATTVASYLPYTAAAMMAGVTSGGGMPPIARGVTPLPLPAAAGVVAGAALLLAAVAAVTSTRRDII
jgi:ABC-type transport system involved in multi-copper enzyme maturation permease subunit